MYKCNTSFVYWRELAPAIVSLTGDWVRGDDSHNYYYSLFPFWFRRLDVGTNCIGNHYLVILLTQLLSERSDHFMQDSAQNFIDRNYESR